MAALCETAARLYAALKSRDVEALVELLDPGFIARVSEGMPLGVGGDIRGPREMVLGVWGKVAGAFDAVPHPDEYLQVGPDRVIVLGWYRGTSRATGRQFQAAFAHDLVVRDGKLVSLTQITDTKPWHDAAEPR